jgi:HTH-type transcriptional regulator, transcriptional repressor of NAD biosynthesis genes
MTVTRRGLTLGKFAPLHRGHQYLIETALSEMDEVVVIIYDSPEVTPVPLNVRANWIRELYPQVRLVQAWDGPGTMGDTPEIHRLHEEYILGKLKISGITHFYSSEFYGKHMSKALGAVNRQVDGDRAAFPISGTQARENPYANRVYLHPRVYRDLITNVVLLGAPSTGKTTLAERLARESHTAWMPEYGREDWDTYQVDRRLTLEQLVEIAEGHLKREEALLLEADRYLFTDTNALTTRLFSLYYHGCAASRLEALAAACALRYDLVLVCDTDIPYDDTWDRSGDANRLVFQKQVISDLIVRKIPFFLLKGDLEERVCQAKQILETHPKYSNILNPQGGSLCLAGD